jgi:predicted MPP superfamily phosphohydrolase
MLAEAAGLIGAAGGAALAWATLVERRWFALRHAEVPALRGAGRLRVLHLSDLHLLPWQRDKMAWVRGLGAHAPDLVVVTGDILGHPGAVEPAVATLAALTATGAPALVVLGSNDFFAPTPRNPLAYLTGPSHVRPGRVRLETDRMVAGIAEHGWTLLDNTRAVVETPAGPVDAAGLGDPHIRRDRPDLLDRDHDAPDAVLRLGVVHAPYLRALDALQTRGAELVLAGHTHGGQVRVPGVGALVTNCDLPRRQARGLSRHGAAWLHVSAGCGTSMYAPVRFCCRPEATLIDVVAAPSL